MKEDKGTLLIVDDEEANLHKLKRTFLGEFKVLSATSGPAALELMAKNAISAIITDQRMPGITGVELLRQSLTICPDAVRIILTGYTEVEDLMDAINDGQVHRYITKPWEPVAVRQSVHQELERRALIAENARLTEELREANLKLQKENSNLKQEMKRLKGAGQPLIYESSAMKDLLHMVDRVGETDSTVLIQGETGTGKELLARYIHQNSPRAAQPFVAVNCGAVPADLVESAFFGHRKGAFTGATEDSKGYFEMAEHGTLFLDEIGEAPLDLQVKLLRVLQDGQVRSVGGQTSRSLDVRIVASTNRNLAERVRTREFRQDLYFRLNVFAVLVPPLRGRTDDVDVLAEFFLQRYAARVKKSIPGFSPETMERLRKYDWPGNVRELENEIERLVIFAESQKPISPDELSERVRNRVSGSNGDPEDDLRGQLSQLERRLILQALQENQNNKSHAARSLGITRQTIIAKLKQYDL